ncbi:MAG TPA: FtsX-like permease family protein [Thermoanaerobaculia bacterium]|jgi:putative ABC transport system permease protein|nr:FtsX-like permease family protein [Thermoanaerobaculia bacterium]
MYARLLMESLRRGTRRKLLAVTAVALGILGATALVEVVLASEDRLAADLASYGANLEMVPARSGETLPIHDLAEVRRIFWRNNIVAIAPLHTLRVRWEPGDVVAPLVGTWFDRALEPGWRTGLPRTRPTLKLEGRWPREDGGELVLGRRLAERLGVRLGGELRAHLGAQREDLRVVGLLTSGGEEDDQAFVPIEAVQRLADQPGRFTRAEIFALTSPESRNTRPDPSRMSAEEYEAWYCTAYPSSIAFQLNRALPRARTSVVHGVTQATADVLGRLRWVLAALAAVALAGAVVGVTAAMTATVLERRLEAGLLVAIGAARGRVVLFFLSEAALLGLLGGLAGGAAGLVAGRLLGSGVLGVAVPWMPVLLPFTAMLGVVVTVLASAAPVARALERYPADILKRATA